MSNYEKTEICHFVHIFIIIQEFIILQGEEYATSVQPVQMCRAKFMMQYPSISIYLHFISHTSLAHLNVKIRARHIANQPSMDSVPKRLTNTDTSEEFASTRILPYVSVLLMTYYIT